MRTLKSIVLALALAAGSTRPAQAQVWTGLLGGAAGVAAGGYITLATVVTRAQFGHYLHEPKQILGWNSAPVLISAATGAALGYTAPDRLGTGTVYGVGGALAGGTAGFIIGKVVSNRPEGKWAGGAIGAGIGMTLGFAVGVLNPNSRFDPTGKSNKAVVPVSYTIHF